MMDFVSQVAYCGIIQVDCIDKEWKVANTCFSVTHGENRKFDWNTMKE